MSTMKLFRRGRAVAKIHGLVKMRVDVEALARENGTTADRLRGTACGYGGAIIVCQIDWRNVPAGFVPPKEQS